MSAYPELDGIIRHCATDYLDARHGHDSTPGDIADAILTKHRAEVVAEFEAYPGELAMLRGVLGVVRAIARHGDLVDTEGVRELRRVIAEHYADERDAYAEQGEKATPTGTTATPQPTARERLQLLLHTIHTQSGQWTTRRALKTYQQLRIRVYRSTVRHDLAALHRAGHLALHDEDKGRRYYTPQGGDAG